MDRGTGRVLPVSAWAVLRFCVFLILLPSLGTSILMPNYYANECPNVESIVRKVVKTKMKQTFVTTPATLRLFFHDCLVEGCDASVMIASREGNTAEKDHEDNLSLAGDGFDTVIKAKAAVDAVASCKNKVSCADILTIATRDVIDLSGGPYYQVELGRLDGLVSRASNVDGKIPKPTFNLDQLTRFFASIGLNQVDLIALSAAHTVGFSHCDRFAHRIYNFTPQSPVDPTLNETYVSDLKSLCPIGVDPRIAVDMDPTTPRKFDNAYYKNLRHGKGLFSSDQILFTDFRSRPIVNIWAKNSKAFNRAFIEAITKLGRLGVKTQAMGDKNGNIRHDCSIFN